MVKYTVFVAYTLEGESYTEKSNLKSTHKLFNTPEEAIEAIKNEIEQECHNKDYKEFEFELKLPKFIRLGKDNGYLIESGYFECAYISGPIVHYDIYINTIHLD